MKAVTRAMDLDNKELKIKRGPLTKPYPFGDAPKQKGGLETIAK
jgi:hypothetical protein